MAERHPYVSAPGGLVKTITHFRRSLPGTLTGDTLKKLGHAPQNESYVLNVLRFLGFVGEQDAKTEVATQVFSQHQDDDFQAELGSVVRKAYTDLFELHGDGAWLLSRDALIQYFRTTDGTSAIVGQRQASTFQVLAALSGHGDLPATRAANPVPSKPKTAQAGSKASRTESGGSKKTPAPKAKHDGSLGGLAGDPKVGLTVRVEINLPADGDKDTYDRIFSSIRKNLIDG